MSLCINLNAKNMLITIVYIASHNAQIQTKTKTESVPKKGSSAGPKRIVHSKDCFVYHATWTKNRDKEDWVNPCKRGGMDSVFRALAGLLRGKS